MVELGENGGVLMLRGLDRERGERTQREGGAGSLRSGVQQGALATGVSFRTVEDNRPVKANRGSTENLTGLYPYF
jgi:hypothetical protein